MKPRAVILLSGGMDSATILAMACEQGFDAYALSVAYGQRHHVELEAAENIAKQLGAIEHRIVHVDMNQWGGSALTSTLTSVPMQPSAGIPLTYVPARNTIMLSLALSWAEVLETQDIFIGVNSIDCSGYPDCRPEYIRAFEHLAKLATKAGVEGIPVKIHTPLQYLSKSEIIEKGRALGLDYRHTISCYKADSNGLACGFCDACRLRKQGFLDLGIPDQTCYISSK